MFDSTPLADDPDGCIGSILVDKQEANLMRGVTSTIDRLLDAHFGSTDAEYFAAPEWQAVLSAAQAAVVVICADDGQARRP